MKKEFNEEILENDEFSKYIRDIASKPVDIPESVERGIKEAFDRIKKEESKAKTRNIYKMRNLVIIILIISLCIGIILGVIFFN